MIDIIVPVHNAHDDLVRCVASVLEHTTGEYRLVLIDDGSTDPAIGDYFAALEGRADPRIVLLANAQNLGFVGTANRGFGLSEDDVLLLNSDTVVSPGWLDRIRRCADSDPAIGTITPFSNNAEICSFPELFEGKALEQVDLARLSRVMGRLAAPCYPELPTAVGFCMYVRRAVLDRIGGFDAESFGSGYGEENDFSLRASAAGYRNVLCVDAFVAHVGGRSYGTEKSALAERNMKRLLELHPHYDLLVAQFIAADPLAPYRVLIRSMLAADAKSGLPGVLYVIPATDRVDPTAGMGDRREYVLAVQGSGGLLDDLNCGAPARYRFVHSGVGPLVARLCATFGLQRVQYHADLHSIDDTADTGNVAAMTSAELLLAASAARQASARRARVDRAMELDRYRKQLERTAQALEHAEQLALERLEESRALSDGLALAEKLALERAEELERIKTPVTRHNHDWLKRK